MGVSSSGYKAENHQRGFYKGRKFYVTFEDQNTLKSISKGQDVAFQKLFNSWVSLGYFAVNLSGGQPKMYWWLCCTGVKKSHEIAHICCQTQGQHIQWNTISLRWLCIDLKLTPSEIMMSRETQEYLNQWRNLTLARLRGASEYHNEQDKVFSWLPERARWFDIKSWPAFSLYVIICSYEG